VSLLRSAPSSFVELGHARVPVWTRGSGPHVVFVHGWPLTGDTWRGVVHALAEACTCVTFDLPGAGLSEWTDPNRLTLPELARAICEVVRSLPSDAPVILVGHDSGGGLARMAADQLGNRVVGMVLANTEIPNMHSWRFRALFAAIALPGAGRFLGLLLRTRLGRYLLLRDAVVDRRLIRSELSPRFLEPLGNDPRLMAGALAVVTRVNPADFDAIGQVHPRFTGTVRLVWGVQDPWFPLQGARNMLTTFGGRATLTEVPNAGLLVHEEAPTAVADVVRELVLACSTESLAAPSTAVHHGFSTST
jgi:haloalkane dehalogenase